MAIGEYDKRLVILSKEKGKISAFAKGARKQNSALLACSQAFVFGEFQVYEGRTANTIVSAEVKDYFLPLREDLTLMSYASYFCELAGYYCSENNDELPMLKLLYQTLRILGKKLLPCDLVRAVYELKAITINGEGPQVFECVHCGKTSETYSFSAEQGGVLCETCARHRWPLQVSTVYAMQYIVSKEIEKLYSFSVNNSVKEELIRVMKEYYQYHISYHFKSLEFLSIL